MIDLAESGHRISAGRRMTRPAFLGLAALAVLLLGAFAPVLGAGFLNWDDNLLVVENAHLAQAPLELGAWALTSFHGGHWEPLTWLSLGLDRHLWGLEPAGFHATNLALHALQTLFVFALARTLYRAAAGSAGRLEAAALLAAALFALHPQRVESVAWIAERRDLLASPLYVAATLLWLRHAREGARGALFLSYGVFALALGARASGLSWPLAFLLLDAWPLRRAARLGWRPLLLEKLPFFVLSALAAIPALLALRSFGATEMGAGLDPAQRAAQVAYGVVHYPLRALVPFGLSPLYLLDLELDPLAPRYVGSALAALALSAAALALRRRAPAFSVAWFAYLFLIAPFSGLTANGIHLVADRYSYTAGLPLALLGGAVLLAPVTRARGLGARGALLLAVVLLLAVATRAQTRHWRDSRALWQRVVAIEPESYVGWTKLGLASLAAGERELALEQLTRAIEIRPAYAAAWTNRGALKAREDPCLALADFERAAELRPKDPLTRLNRGAARLVCGDPAGAALDFEAALDAAPPDWPMRAAVERRAQEARELCERTPEPKH